MPADPTAGHSDDCSRHCLPLTASAQPNGERSRVVRIPQRLTNPPPIRAICHCARGRLLGRMRNLALSISLLRVIAEGAGS